MNQTAIRAVDLSKRYRIGVARPQPRSRLGKVARLLTSPFNYLADSLREPSEDEVIWSLKDVSFEIGHGEVVGIIGRNGAGKSTLLKILSRITEPTGGYADIYGRVGSLLEVGTGFHPDLTGRENVYMNGTILGMKKAEIDRKFDEIVDFAGIAKFIDTPVKYYSSGMHVRLGFAVAAHLEPEILLIDEVLAVGDFAFQRKCLGKMNDVAKAGRTVLFVSHNMAAVQRLCPRTLLIRDGQIVCDDTSANAIKEYMADFEEMQVSNSLENVPRSSKAYGLKARIVKASLLDEHNKPCKSIPLGSPFSIVTEVRGLESVPDFSLEIGFASYEGQPVTTLASEEAEVLFSIEEGETIKIQSRFDDLMLNTGRYLVRLRIRWPRSPSFDFVSPALIFEVTDVRHPNAYHLEDAPGFTRTHAQWQIR